MNEPNAPSVAVCIATYKRPDGLRALLEGIAEQEWSGPLTTIVVDNDPAGRQGIAVVDEIRSRVTGELIGLVESQSGIPFPRNAAIEAALSRDVQLLAFIDDDERPRSDWLTALHGALEAGADLAGGPQLPVFPSTATADQRATSYYGHDQHLPEHSLCQLQSSGNFMIRASALKPLGPPWFAPRYAQTSGADHDLFRRLEQAGALMRWAPAAAVLEDIPPHRLDEQWLRERVIEIHNGRVRIDREYRSGPQATALRLGKSFALGVQAVLFTAVGLVRPGLAHRAKLTRWKFIGKATAHLGRVTHRIEDRPSGTTAEFVD